MVVGKSSRLLLWGGRIDVLCSCLVFKLACCSAILKPGEGEERELDDACGSVWLGSCVVARALRHKLCTRVSGGGRLFRTGQSAR